MRLSQNEMKFLELLEQFNPKLKEIHDYIVGMASLGYGEIVLTIKCHNYMSKMVDLKAVKPKKGKNIPVSVSKRIIVIQKGQGNEKGLDKERTTGVK